MKNYLSKKGDPEHSSLFDIMQENTKNVKRDSKRITCHSLLFDKEDDDMMGVFSNERKMSALGGTPEVIKRSGPSPADIGVVERS